MSPRIGLISVAVFLLVLTASSAVLTKLREDGRNQPASTTQAVVAPERTGEQATMLPVGLPLMRAPKQLVARCERSRLLRPVCPKRLPAVHRRYASTLCPAGKRGCLFREGIDMFDVQLLPSADRRVRRPAFIHVVLYAGDLGGPKGFQAHAPSAFPFDWPDPSTARHVRNGLSQQKRTAAISLGRYTFGDVAGDLVLAPSIQAMDGDHLIFRWRSGRREYAISLHAWEPLTSTAATLRAIVAAIPAAHA